MNCILYITFIKVFRCLGFEWTFVDICIYGSECTLLMSSSDSTRVPSGETGGNTGTFSGWTTGQTGKSLMQLFMKGAKLHLSPSLCYTQTALMFSRCCQAIQFLKLSLSHLAFLWIPNSQSYFCFVDSFGFFPCLPVCECVCVCVCVHVFVNVCMSVCVWYVFVCVSVSLSACVSVSVCLSVWERGRKKICVCLCNICVCVWGWVGDR